MRKQLAVLSLFVITNMSWSQTVFSVKQKIVVSKDSINKNKTVTIEPVVIKDSVEVDTLKLKLFKKSVIASYYADKFEGRRTTSGTKFSNNHYTAAHKKLPFGTKVKVTNEDNCKSVILEITDRGPFIRSREIDLTKRAFIDIAENIKSGIIRVKIEIIEN